MSPSCLSVIITWYVSDGGRGGRGRSSRTAGAGAVQIQTTGLFTGINHFLRHSRSQSFAVCRCISLQCHNSHSLRLLREIARICELRGRGGGGEVMKGGEWSELGELLGLLDPGPGLEHGVGLEPVARVEVD